MIIPAPFHDEARDWLGNTCMAGDPGSGSCEVTHDLEAHYIFTPEQGGKNDIGNTVVVCHTHARQRGLTPSDPWLGARLYAKQMGGLIEANAKALAS